MIGFKRLPKVINQTTPSSVQQLLILLSRLKVLLSVWHYVLLTLVSSGLYVSAANCIPIHNVQFIDCTVYRTLMVYHDHSDWGLFFPVSIYSSMNRLFTLIISTDWERYVIDNKQIAFESLIHLTLLFCVLVCKYILNIKYIKINILECSNMTKIT